MREFVIKIKELFPRVSFVGTRPSGEKVRAIMEQQFEQGNVIILDFENINGITQAFGDEIIGIFTRQHGKEFIREHVKAINYNNEIKEVLNWVVSYSNKDFEKRIRERYNVNDPQEV